MCGGDKGGRGRVDGGARMRIGVGEGLITKVQACLCLLEAGNGRIKREDETVRGQRV